MTHEPVVEILRKARVLIEAKGWRQGGADGSGKVCAGVAIEQAAGDDSDLWHEPKAAFLLAADLRPHSYIFPWNDANGRTQAEVLAAFDRAIAATSGKPPAGPSENTPE